MVTAKGVGKKRAWNAGNCCGTSTNKIDDIKYFKELI